MRARSLMMSAAALMVACTLTGCSVLNQIVGQDNWKEWTPDQTSLQISQSGSVTETIIDTLDENYYNADELQDMIARSVREYNTEQGSQVISVPAYSADQGKINLVLVYKTPQDYASYNQVTFLNGSMLDVQMSGITFPDTFQKIDGTSVSENSVSSEEALSHKEYSAAVTAADHVIQVPGQIRYLSENAELVNSHVARPAGENAQSSQPETEAGLVLPSNAVYYGTEDTSQSAEPSQDQEELMYIIYEEDQESST